MKNLRILWGVKQEGGGNWLLREGPKLSTTLKKLKISISTMEGLDAAFNCPSLMSDGLHAFHCELKEGVGLRFNKPISNHQHLHKLRLIGEIQMKLPLILPFNLVTLELKDSILNDEDPMAAIGALAHLRLLRLSNAYVGTSLMCDPDSFPQLEEFYLENFKNLYIWRIEKGAMNCLKRLEIVNCKKLGHFPYGLASITTLQQLEFYAMSEEFAQKARAAGCSQKRIKLPNNADAIIQQSDSPVDISSIAKLYEQLIVGIFLNGHRQKFWVLKQDDLYINCFIVYALDLRVLSSMKFTYINSEDGPYGGCSQMTERSEDGTLSKTSKLLKILRLQGGVIGKHNVAYLSPNVTYEVFWEIMLVEKSKLSEATFKDQIESEQVEARVYTESLSEIDVSTKLAFSEQALNPVVRRESLRDKPTNEWIRLGAGEFKAHAHTTGDLTVSLNFLRDLQQVALLIKGFSIEPKL